MMPLAISPNFPALMNHLQKLTRKMLHRKISVSISEFHVLGKKWHDRRKIITPAFHFNILEKFVEIFDRLGNTVVEKLRTNSPNEMVQFYPLAVLYALDVMCGKFPV